MAGLHTGSYPCECQAAIPPLFQQILQRLPPYFHDSPWFSINTCHDLKTGHFWRYKSIFPFDNPKKVCSTIERKWAVSICLTPLLIAFHFNLERKAKCTMQFEPCFPFRPCRAPLDGPPSSLFWGSYRQVVRRSKTGKPSRWNKKVLLRDGWL